MSLQMFGTGKTLCTVGEVYGVAENMILKIMRNFCRLVRIDLQRNLYNFQI